MGALPGALAVKVNVTQCRAQGQKVPNRGNMDKHQITDHNESLESSRFCLILFWLHSLDFEIWAMVITHCAASS